jgi:hypothetical protein
MMSKFVAYLFTDNHLLFEDVPSLLLKRGWTFQEKHVEEFNSRLNELNGNAESFRSMMIFGFPFSRRRTTFMLVWKS